eukprot:470550-Hanusia_phi.AAC.1
MTISFTITIIPSFSVFYLLWRTSCSFFHSAKSDAANGNAQPSATLLTRASGILPKSTIPPTKDLGLPERSRPPILSSPCPFLSSPSSPPLIPPRVLYLLPFPYLVSVRVVSSDAPDSPSSPLHHLLPLTPLQIPNKDWFEDLHPHNMHPMDAIGIELLTNAGDSSSLPFLLIPAPPLSLLLPPPLPLLCRGYSQQGLAAAAYHDHDPDWFPAASAAADHDDHDDGCCVDDAFWLALLLDHKMLTTTLQEEAAKAAKNAPGMVQNLGKALNDMQAQ